MSSRSTLIKFNNETNSALSRTYMNLDHGVWSSNMVPSETIPAHESSTCQSESDGFMTGTEGTVSYNLPGKGEVKLNWDNPFSGSNEYSATAPAGCSIARDGGGGNNASVTFTLTCSS